MFEGSKDVTPQLIVGSVHHLGPRRVEGSKAMTTPTVVTCTASIILPLALQSRSLADWKIDTQHHGVFLAMEGKLPSVLPIRASSDIASQGDKNSAESFEKTLSALSDKISKATAHNDRLRQRARKLKVSWILYGGVTYILAFLILTLVTGWRNWGPVEYSTVAGGPVL